MNYRDRTDLFASTTIAGSRRTIQLQPHLSQEQRDEAMTIIAAAFPPQGYGTALRGSTITLWSAD